MDEVKIEYFVLSIYYVITDFKENYDEIFEQVINTPFSLYVTHVKVFFSHIFQQAEICHGYISLLFWTKKRLC